VALPVAETVGHHVRQPDAVLDAVNARRVTIDTLRPRVPRGLSGIDGVSARRTLAAI